MIKMIKTKSKIKGMIKPISMKMINIKKVKKI